MVHDYGFLIPLLLGLWAYISIIAQLTGLWWAEALISGALTGLIVGDVNLGLQIGATLTLMSLGMWTYGGATMPDFNTGAIIGTAIGALGSGLEGGLAIAIPTSILMTQLDVLARATTTVFIHGADKHLEKGNLKGITKMHLLGQIPWGLSRGIPVFLAVWLGAGPIQKVIEWFPEWFMGGMQLAGKVLPALGFALLLNQINVKKYWPFLLVGFALFAYINMPIMGIAMLGLAIAIVYMRLEGGSSNA
ncbi:MAG: PTS sugar transporter subunit IIC [Firmicutes bacterium]|nr:PTS sugar transporter subunit IIC [Bacillota bacterium]